MRTAKVILSIFLTVLAVMPLQARSKQKQDTHEPEIQSQWKGARAAFLGIEAYCYGINGHTMGQIIGQAEKLEDEHGQDVDAIVVFAGTNDYNAQGLFIDDYVEAIKEAGNVWAVPVIDLNSISGLYPNMYEQVRYFRNSETDRLHPGTEGHRRMACSLAYQLLGYPAKLD